MPALHGASAEFILNDSLPHHPSGILRLDAIPQDTILIGHILGGLDSPTLNPFSANQTNTTSASAVIYAVHLIRTTPSGLQPIDGRNPYDFTVAPVDGEQAWQVSFDLKNADRVRFFITGADGKILSRGRLAGPGPGHNHYTLRTENMARQPVYITLVFNDSYFVTRGVLP
jgi:hypothetical protein